MRSRCGSRVRSCSKNHRIATRRFSSSARRRSVHSMSLSAEELLLHEMREVLGVATLHIERASTPSSSSAANSRTVVSIRNRGSARAASTLTRLWPASASRRSSVASSVVPQTAEAAVRVQPSVKTGQRASASLAPARRAARRSTRRWLGAFAGVRGGRQGRCPARPARSRGEPAEREDRAGGSSRQRARSRAEHRRGAGRSPRRLRCSRAVSAKVRRTAQRPIDEQTHSRKHQDVSGRRTVHGSRDHQRTDDVLVLCAKPQHHSARRQNLELRAPAEQLVEFGCDLGYLLEVVENEQGARGEKLFDQRVLRRPSPLERSAGSRRRLADITEAASVIAASGTKSTRGSSRSLIASPTAMASRVFPMPPGPLRVTIRMSRRVQQGDDRVDVIIATDQRSRRDRQRAIGTARENRPLPRSVASPIEEAHETLAQQQCQISAHKPPQLSRRAESAVGLSAPLADLVDHRGSTAAAGLAPVP